MATTEEGARRTIRVRWNIQTYFRVTARCPPLLKFVQFDSGVK